MTKALEKQVGGDHYKSLAIQPVEYIVQNGLGWFEGNIVKYITRHKQKGGRKDVEKVIHYAQMLLEEYDDDLEHNMYVHCISPSLHNACMCGMGKEPDKFHAYYCPRRKASKTIPKVVGQVDQECLGEQTDERGLPFGTHRPLETQGEKPYPPMHERVLRL